jgi:hypothetical protein
VVDNEQNEPSMFISAMGAIAANALIFFLAQFL